MSKYLYERAEYARPWKLATLALGVVFLLAGALWSGLPDWDLSVSIIMAVPAYLTAAPSMRVFVERKWKLLPMALFWTWFTVDGTYSAYWYLREPEVLAALRPANAGVSLALYGMCGLVWYPTASLREMKRHALTRAA